MEARGTRDEEEVERGRSRLSKLESGARPSRSESSEEANDVRTEEEEKRSEWLSGNRNTSAIGEECVCVEEKAKDIYIYIERER